MFPALIDAGWQCEAVGFTAAKGSDVIGALEKLTAWIMEVSLGAVGNDLSCYKIWLSNHIFLHKHGNMVSVRLHCAVHFFLSFLRHAICAKLVSNFHGCHSMTLLNLRSQFCTLSKMAQKRTRYALWKLAVAVKVLKNVSCFSLDRCIAWHDGIELGSMCDCRVIYRGCVFLDWCQELFL